MPITLRIDRTQRRLFTRAEGLVTYAEIRAHIHSDLSPEEASYGELVDCSGATTNVTAAEIRQLAGERKRVGEGQLQPGPVAIVATDSVFFGMFRMFDILTEKVRPIRVFRDSVAAVEWLDKS